MQFSFNWLQKLSQTKRSASQVAKDLTLRSFEVEGVEKWEVKLDKKIIVSQIKEIKKHPNADKLQIVKVDTGKKEITLVTGASNIKIGQKVPLALEGAKLPSGLKIKATRLRGIESKGMLCAEDELGVGNDHSGILILDSNAPLGKSIQEYFSLEKDNLLEIDILPNRAHDCLSYRGVAREIVAIEKRNFKDKIKKEAEKEWKKIISYPNTLPAKILTKDCFRYTGIKIKNFKVEPSPFWLQNYLRKSGIQPINNIVDITNYVMLETGQPLHAFDASLLKMPIIIRQAKKDEKIKLLDNQKIKLIGEEIIIADKEKPIALAGIMGGKESGIKSDTQEIIIEGASFNSSKIRFSSRLHNLTTEASYRFERDLDPNLTSLALSRALQLIKITGGNEVELENWIDIYPQKIKPWKIILSKQKVKDLLGVEIKEKTIKSILERLDLKVKNFSTQFEITIATERKDLQTPEDLIEEIGRFYGYENIQPQPLQEYIKLPRRNEKRFFEKIIKDVCVASGWDEIRGYSFYSQANAQVLKLDKKDHLKLLNPDNQEQAWMRQSLSVTLLKAARLNLSYFKEIKIFEIGKIYLKQKDVLPQEEEMLGALVSSENKQGEQFYKAKGLAENIFSRARLSDYYWNDNINDEKIPFFSHPSRKALIQNNKGEILGWVAEVNRKVLQYFGIKNQRVAILEINLSLLRKLSQEKRMYMPLAKFPPVNRDISLRVSRQTKVAEIESLIYETGGELLQEVDLFDMYINEEEGERALGFHLIFQSKERTLSSQEVEKLMQNIFKKLEKELGANIRK